MQKLNVGINAGHLKESAVNCKTLGTLGEEADKLANLPEGGIRYESEPDTRTLDRKYLFHSKENLDSIKKELEGKTPEEILAMTGIKTTVLEDGRKIISGYHAPTSWCTYKELGINEEELLDKVVTIHGDCDLAGSYLKNLGSVERITGRLFIPTFSNLEDLSGLKEVRYIKCDAADADTVKDILSKLNLKCSTKGINNFYNTPLYQSDSFDNMLKSFMASGVYKPSEE